MTPDHSFIMGAAAQAVLQGVATVLFIRRLRRQARSWAEWLATQLSKSQDLIAILTAGVVWIDPSHAKTCQQEVADYVRDLQAKVKGQP